MTRSILAPTLLILLAAGVRAAEEKPDLAVVHKIKAEAFQRGQVMDHLFWLTDANGPRLTGSPGYNRAADWAVQTLQRWGAQKAHLEKWGPFGRGWTARKFSIRLLEPATGELSGVPRAWCGGTNGPIAADVVYAPLIERHEKEDLVDLSAVATFIRRYVEQNRGKLRGKIVLQDALRELEPPKNDPSTRYADARLQEIFAAPEPVMPFSWEWPLSAVPREKKKREEFLAQLPLEVVADFWQRRRAAYEPLWDFFVQEGVSAVFTTDDRGDGGLVFAESTGGWDPRRPLPPPAIVVAPEHYDRLVRLAEKKLPAKVELDLKVELNDAPEPVNVIAEIPGTKKKDEVVMLGAHLDSWHAGTGATDNAAGSAVMLEAFRILQALHLPMDRTVRIALWSGEEQGLLGSRAYVRQHFGDPVTMQLKPEHARLSAYFNVDNGSGKIRGVWLQGNDMARPVFEPWLAPFRDEGATTLSIRNTGGTDHESFDAVGLPGFQFIQDPLDYMSRTHHSTLDVYDHAVPADLMQAAAIVASFVYDTANRPEMLPRKPLPRQLPPKRTAVSRP